MNKRFVFESFQEFLDFANGNINEKKIIFPNFGELQTYLGRNGLNEDGKDALSYAQELSTKTTPVLEEYYEDVLNRVGVAIGNLNSGVTEIEKIVVDVKDIDYGNLVGGAAVTNIKLSDERGGIKASSRHPLANLLTFMNRRNIYGKTVNVDKDKKMFMPYKKDGKIAGDYIKIIGLDEQWCLLGNSGSLDFDKYRDDEPVTNFAVKPEGVQIESILYTKAKKEGNAGEWSGTYLIYYPIAIEIGKGEDYKSTELIEVERPVSKKAETLNPIIIQNDDVLFDQGKSVLKEEGKAAILNALSNVTAAKTIKVTGGASKEGTREINEKLCRDRAQAVADFLSKGAFKNAQITVSETADIQDANDEKIDESRRRVILDIEGERLVTITKTETETEFSAQQLTNKADKATIRQVAINIISKFV